jgi:acetoin utilization protein AcuB
MTCWECHHLPVVASDGNLVGIITDHDCRTALGLPDLNRVRWEKNYLASQLRVRTFMTAEPIVADVGMMADEAARLMLEHRVNCLPVLREGTVVGMVTMSDVLVAFIRLSSYLAAQSAPIRARIA